MLHACSVLLVSVVLSSRTRLLTLYTVKSRNDIIRDIPYDLGIFNSRAQSGKCLWRRGDFWGGFERWTRMWVGLSKST